MWAWLAIQMMWGVAMAEPPAEPSPIAVSFHGDRGPSISIRATGDAVALPACRGVSWERWDLDSEQFVLLPQQSCGPMSPAILVDQQGREVAAPDGLGLTAGDRVRVHVVVGLGCELTRPMPLEVAGCARILQVLGALGEVK